MVSSYDIGDLVRLSSTWTDTGDSKGDPGLAKLVYTTPDGSDTIVSGTSGGLSHPDTGQFYYDITTTSSGPYYYRYSSTGTLTSAAEGVFRVRKRYTSTG